MAKFAEFGKGLLVGVAISVVTEQVLDEIGKWTHLSKDGKQYLSIGVNLAIATGIILADPYSVWHFPPQLPLL